VASIDFKKHNDDFHSQVDVLGMPPAPTARGRSLQRRGECGLHQGCEAGQESPFYYEIPSRLLRRIHPQAGTECGRREFRQVRVPLVVEPFSGKDFTLSGPAFGDALAPYPMDSAELDPALMEGSIPWSQFHAGVPPAAIILRREAGGCLHGGFRSTIGSSHRRRISLQHREPEDEPEGL